MKKYVLLFLVFIVEYVSGQNNNFILPQILPASPEPSSFMKANLETVNFSTGAATARIPLFDIKLNDFTYPIALSYSTTGLKVDEACSRVGLGWVLNAAGMISRSVKGTPDEYASRLGFSSTILNTDDNFENLKLAADNTLGFDSQPDEFQFSFNGYSGKFVLDSNHVPRVTSTSNLKISVDIVVTPGSTDGNISNIVIITPDGVKYTFGGAYEKTISHNIQAHIWYQNTTKTTFFLDRIDLPTHEYIIFNYSLINNRAIVGKTQEHKIAKTISVECGNCNGFSGYTSQENQISYSSRYLNSITTSNGTNIYLGYENRPDLSYDNRLISLEIAGYKKYVFSYYDVAGSANVITGRFFLTKLQEQNIVSPTDADVQHNYLFQYNDLTEVPLPGNGQQDYLGYANGSATIDLIPPTYNSGNGSSMDFSFRNPNPTYSKKGTLSVIQYPTGGQQRFIYEGNTQNKPVLRNTFVNVSLSGTGTTTYTSNNFTLPKDEKVYITTYAADAILNDSYTPDSYVKTVAIWVYEGSTLVGSRSTLAYNVDNTSLDLYGGHTYRLVMRVYNYTEIGYCTLSYDSSMASIYDNISVDMPGVRVKQIMDIDPSASKINSRYYTYASLSNLNQSSGSCRSLSFLSYYPRKVYCGDLLQFETECNVEVYSSSSTSDLYNYSGSGSVFYYKTVIESDNLDFANGGTEYTFFDNDNGTNASSILGVDISNIPIPAGQYPTLSGMLYKTRKFNAAKEIVEEEINDYETLSDLSHAVESYYVRYRYFAPIQAADRMQAFDVVKYFYTNEWIRLKSKTTNLYSQGNLLTQKTDYYYGTTANILPAYTITTDSKNIQGKIEKKYPTDFLGIGFGVYDEMVKRNILSPVVQQNVYSANNLLLQTNTTYSFWPNNIISPINVQQQKQGGLMENRLQFNVYGNNARILEQQKPNDVKEVYLWGYNNTYPIAKIVGSDYNTVVQYVTQAQIDAAIGLYPMHL